MRLDFFKKLIIANLPVRPSKAFLYDRLEKKLFDIRGEIGLDAASESFKNKRMFKTKFYYGLDIRSEALIKGVIKQGDGRTFGILADLARLDMLPGDSVDAVVSTNTLYCLDKEDRIAAVKQLFRLTAPDGFLFLELPASVENDFNSIISLARDVFTSVKIIYYRNYISRAYENIFEKNGWLGTHPIAQLKAFRLLAWIIGRLEYLTAGFHSPKKHALIICTDKKTKPSRKKFDLSGLEVEKSIYNILEASRIS